MMRAVAVLVALLTMAAAASLDVRKPPARLEPPPPEAPDPPPDGCPTCLEAT